MGLRNLVTRVMNDAFSSLPADQLLNNLVRSARSVQSTPAPGLQPVPNQALTNLHFSSNAPPPPPLQKQQGLLNPGLLGHNQGVKPFNQGLSHNHNPQGPPNLVQNVPGSLNLGLNRGLNPPGPPNNHNQALGAFPGPHNQERRGGNRVNLFSFLHGGVRHH